MSTLLKHRPVQFEGFGPSILARQSRGRLQRNVVPCDRMEARSLLHDQCPLTPGVYGWLDSHDQICYVGKSKSLRKRLLSYFAKTPADKKAERIRQHSERLVWEPISNELLALIREQELIYRWRPDFNTQGQPTRRQPAFICIGGGPAPNVFFTRRLTPKAAHAFGPVAGTSQLRAAIVSMNQVFQLRDCPDKTRFEFSEQGQLFGNPQSAKCIRFELGSCPAPCAGNCSKANYQERVDRALSFLHGRDLSILTELERRMQAAASSHRFEKAALLRDHLANLNWLHRRLDSLRKAQSIYNGVLPIPGRRKNTIWLVLQGGRILGSAAQPIEASRASRAIEMLGRTACSTPQLPGNIFEMNLQLIMISWFRKHPQQKRDIIRFEDAINFCEQVATGRGKRVA